MVENADMHLVSTWISPFTRTMLTVTTCIADIWSNRNAPGQFTVVLAYFHLLILLETTNLQQHTYITKIIQSASFIILYWLCYCHLAVQSAWEVEPTGWWVFAISCILLISVYWVHMLLKSEKDGEKQKLQIIALFSFVCMVLPNAINSSAERVVWEYSFRCFLFLFSTWFCLFVSVLSNKQEDQAIFFNKYAWVLIAHRYLIPLVGILWMQTAMQMTSAFSAKPSSTGFVNDQHTYEERELLCTGNETKIEQDDVKGPSMLFQNGHKNTVDGTVLNPLNQNKRMLRKWTSGTTSSFAGRRRFTPIQNHAAEQLVDNKVDQLAKLQQMAMGVDAV